MKKVILVNLLVLTVLLLGMELLFGNWLSCNRHNSLNLIRNAEYRIDVGDLYETDHRFIIYKRDQYGLRGNYGSLDNIDILTVGGSTTDERYVGEGGTWQDVLQREFLSHGKKINIANAGVDGQSTYGHIKDFDWWFSKLPKLKVRYFLFYAGINDFNKDSNDEFDNLAARTDPHPAGLMQQIRDKSALFYMYRTIKGILRTHADKAGHNRIDFASVKWVRSPSVSSYEELMRTRLDAYVSRLTVLIERTRKEGQAIFVTQPTRQCKQVDGQLIGTAETTNYDGKEINGVDHCLMMEILNRKTMETCQASGSICIDLASELEFEDRDFYDYYHNNPKGTGKIGKYLYDKLKTHL